MNISDILLDVEGTTTPIDFVFKVLFPYAKERLPSFLIRNANNSALKNDLELLKSEYINEEISQDIPEYKDDPISYLNWLIEVDRKSPALKSIQGKIWEEGFNSGKLKGEVFDDIRPSFERWKSQGKRISIYSSGSVLAQKMLFKNSVAGDLAGFISHHFDTAVGGKREAKSYSNIACELKIHPENILFISDIVEELDAAKEAGMNTLLSVRPGNSALSGNFHEKVENFLQI